MPELKRLWNENPAARLGVLSGLALAAVTLLYVNLAGDGAPEAPRPWAVSLSAGTLVDPGDAATIAADPDLVEVVVLSRGGCGSVRAGMDAAAAASEGATFAYLKKLRDGLPADVASGPADVLVAAAERPGHWVPMLSPDGVAVQNANKPEVPAGEFPDLCTP